MQPVITKIDQQTTGSNHQTGDRMRLGRRDALFQIPAVGLLKQLNIMRTPQLIAEQVHRPSLHDFLSCSSFFTESFICIQRRVSAPIELEVQLIANASQHRRLRRDHASILGWKDAFKNRIGPV